MVVENVLCNVAKIVVRSVASEISAIHENAGFSKMYKSSGVQCFLTFLNCWDPRCFVSLQPRHDRIAPKSIF